MTYNEDDIIEDVMKATQKYFDKILVLDGSTDRTEEIIRSFSNVVYFLKDQDIFPKRKIYDGARQFLLEKAQAMFGYDGWFTLLHGDEIFVDDPNIIAARAEESKAEKVNWHLLNFFLHKSQKETFNHHGNLVDQLVYYQPGNLEIRQFKNKKGIYYPLNQIYSVIPKGIGYKMLWDYPVIRHYVHRGLIQRQKKPILGFLAKVQETKTDISQNILIDDLFLDKLSKDRKQVRHFTGNYNEFTPGKRPSFFRQWLNWHQYA